jgi:hypothetical protein
MGVPVTLQLIRRDEGIPLADDCIKGVVGVPPTARLEEETKIWRICNERHFFKSFVRPASGQN